MNRFLLPLCFVLCSSSLFAADDSKIKSLENENRQLKNKVITLETRVSSLESRMKQLEDLILRDQRDRIREQDNRRSYEPTVQQPVIIYTDPAQDNRTRAQYTVVLKDDTQFPAVTYEQGADFDAWNSVKKKYYIFYLENGTKKKVSIDFVQSINRIKDDD